MFIGGTVIPASAYQESPVWIPGGSAPFVPTDIAGCILWIEGDAVIGTSGDLVSTWPDQSGNSNSPTASGLLRPTLQTNILNGRSVIEFDGSANVMVASYTFNKPNSVFVVFKRTSVGDFGCVFDGIPQFSGMNDFTGAGGLRAYSSGAIIAPITNTVFNYVATIFDGSSSLVTVGGSITSGTLGADPSGGITVGAWGNSGSGGSGNFGPFQIAEIIQYSSPLGVTDRQTVEAYLASKYAL